MSSSPIDPAAVQDDVPQASNRSVGLVLGIVFLGIGLYPLIGGNDIRIWATAPGVLLIILAVIAPQSLTLVARAWLGLGAVLHKVISPVVLGLLYVVAVIPTGLYLKVTGKDPLKLKIDADAKSYWVERTPPGPERTSFPRQF